METITEKTKYWLKLEKNFLQSKYIKIIKNMPNGHEYILFYLALMLESVDCVGHLRFTDLVAYNEQMLSALTDVNIDVVRSAMKIFKELGMVTILEDGTIFMPDVPKLTGKECDSAERVRLFRNKQKLLQCNSDVTNGNDNKENKEEHKEQLHKDKNKDQKERKQASLDLSVILGYSMEYQEAITQLIEHRKQLHKPMTQLALCKTLKELEPYSNEERIATIDVSIASGWAGVFPKPSKPSRTPKQAEPNQFEGWNKI